MPKEGSATFECIGREICILVWKEGIFLSKQGPGINCVAGKNHIFCIPKCDGKNFQFVLNEHDINAFDREWRK